MTDTRTPEVITLPANQPHIDASRAAWIEHARILSTIVRRADLDDVVRQLWTPDLICTKRSWSKEVGDRVCAAADAGEFDRSDFRAWREALGEPESVELSTDGSYIIVDAWCECSAPTDGSDWVYYERWSEVGRVSHGYVCPSCRRLTQTG